VLIRWFFLSERVIYYEAFNGLILQLMLEFRLWIVEKGEEQDSKAFIVDVDELFS